MRLLASPLVRLALVASVLVVVCVGWFLVQVFPIGGPGRAVVVTVHSGESQSQLASDLESRGVIGSAVALKIDLTVFGGITLHPGSYEIRQNASFGTVRAVFGGHPNADVVTVEAGLTVEEVAQQVATVKGATYAHAFEAAATTAAATDPFHPADGLLEGLIGVGTYSIAPHETPASLVAAMTANFTAQAAAVGLVPSLRVHGLSAYQVVIAASIDQKEGYYPQNLGRVARVILNRLARGGGLQMDSTVLYYFHQDGGTVTPAMLRANTPYNTYLHAGLTPTPICTPSAAAIAAVLNPPPGKWLYFTLINKNGTLAFADTFQQQLANERLAASRGIK